MTWFDGINGTFEALGAIATWGNVRCIIRDKKVEGVDWRATCLFTAWGFWNTVFYTTLHLFWSFIGGLAIVSANTIWVILALKYRVPGMKSSSTPVLQPVESATLVHKSGS